MGDDGAPQMAKKRLEDVKEGRFCEAIETIALQGLRFIRAQPGFIYCRFVVPENLAGKDGNWVAGAIATVIDNVGAAAVVSSVGNFKASVNFDITYLSSAKIGEEVEIEAKVLGHKGKLSSIAVEIRKKENGEMVAIGKQWTSSVNAPIESSKLPSSKL